MGGLWGVLLWSGLWCAGVLAGVSGGGGFVSRGWKRTRQEDAGDGSSTARHQEGVALTPPPSLPSRVRDALRSAVAMAAQMDVVLPVVLSSDLTFLLEREGVEKDFADKLAEVGVNTVSRLLAKNFN